MASWSDLMREEPEFGKAVRSRFDAHVHKTVATLRRDGSPRISGIEATFGEGELWIGMMPGSRKAMDLRRDPRLALHSATVDPEMSDGDAKISGRAKELTEQASFAEFQSALGERAESEPAAAGSFHLFRVDITDAVLIRVGEPPDHLVIEQWREGTGFRRIERRKSPPLPRAYLQASSRWSIVSGSWCSACLARTFDRLFNAGRRTLRGGQPSPCR